MIVYAINLFILSILILIVGMIKPKWLLFWLDNPGRMPILWISILLFMVAAVLFGEGNRQKRLQETQTAQQSITKEVPAVLPEKPTSSTQVKTNKKEALAK